MKVFSNLAISLDGKIADVSKPHQMLGSAEDRKRMNLIRKKADVVVFGATTLRANPKCVKIKERLKSQRALANAVITFSGKLDPDWDFWKDPEVLRFVFTSSQGEKEAIKNCRDRAFVVVVGEKSLDPMLILKRLKESGFSKVLLEGGGEAMALFMKKKLIGELYVTLTPWILGGRSSPTLVGGEDALVPWIRLTKIKAEWKKGDLFMHFKVPGSKSV